MFKRILFLLVVLVSLASCSSNKEEPKTMERLSGLWQLKDQPSYESWTKDDDNTYLAKDFVLVNSDTNHTERIKLFKDVNEVWQYEVQLLGGQQPRNITFELDSLSETTMIFRNNTNPFPKSLNYHFPNDSIMQVTLEGEGAVPIYMVFKKRS
jgi:hypothetical protein